MEAKDSINALVEITDEISAILSNEELSPEESDKVLLLYEKRKDTIEEIDDWMKSDDGNAYISRNSAGWNNFLLKMQKTDNSNIKKLEEFIKTTGNSIKELNNKKALFVYSK